MIHTELTRFKVLKGKSEIVSEWLTFLNENMEDVLLTLDGEKMYVETIFREVKGEEEYLYWYSIQGDGGTEVENSPSWIDKKHLEYWNQCIDKSFKPEDLIPEVVMIPKRIQKMMI